MRLWWIRASWWIRCIMVPPINRQARIDRTNERSKTGQSIICRDMQAAAATVICMRGGNRGM
jgi:hypothetical protein